MPPRVRRLRAPIELKPGGEATHKYLLYNGPVKVMLLSQPDDKQKAVIGNAPVKVAIEAAVRWGWDAVIGHDGVFIGMHSFGESGPAKDLFKHFGITAEAAVNAALKRLG